MFRSTTVLLVLAVLAQNASAARMIRFASPLQSLTIPDPEIKETLETKRSRFLPRFRAGLHAEAETRRALAAQRNKELQAAAASGSDWAEQAAESDRDRRARENAIVERAYDEAVAKFDAANKKKKKSSKTGSSSAYQFVGVVTPKGKKPVTWYARKKPSDAKWSVRLVHVNQDAVIKDLFNRGKVDIFAKYKNTGTTDEETKAPIINCKYEVRERSWKNLWNFSPKHVFTDPSGMYWRERRLRPGLYTDGVNVYESSYRYRDGRNGMHRVSGFDQFLSSKSVSSNQKDRILKRLKSDAPDIVLEL